MLHFQTGYTLFDGQKKYPLWVEYLAFLLAEFCIEHLVAMWNETHIETAQVGHEATGQIERNTVKAFVALRLFLVL